MEHNDLVPKQVLENEFLLTQGYSQGLEYFTYSAERIKAIKSVNIF
jgi:hypothetical protein